MVSQTRASWITYVLLLTLSLIGLVSVIYALRTPLFLASVLAGALAGWNERLVGRLHGRRNAAAAFMLTAVVLLLVLPIGGLIAYAVNEAIASLDFVVKVLKEGSPQRLLERLPASMRPLLDRSLRFVPAGLEQVSQSLAANAAAAVSGALSVTSEVLVDGVMMLIALFVLLVDGGRLVDWIAETTPLHRYQTRELLHEFRVVSQSVLGSTVATAGVQCVAATIGYLIARVPHPFFFGLLTFFTAFIPSVGTSVIALPLTLILFLQGHKWTAVFLLLWAVVVVGTVDNLIKPLLIHGTANLHGAVVFFSLLGGLVVFGPLGLIAGPLVVTFFLSMIRLGRRDFFGGRPPSIIGAPDASLPNLDTRPVTATVPPVPPIIPAK